MARRRSSITAHHKCLIRSMRLKKYSSGCSYLEQRMPSMESLRLPLPAEVAHFRDSPHYPASRTRKIPSCSHTTPTKRRRNIPRSTAYNEMELSSTPNERDIRDPFLPYFKAKAVQYGQDVGCVFLLWGSRASIKRATDVLVKGVGTHDNVSEDEIFWDLRKKFQKFAHPWARYLKLRKISSIKPVKVV
jgi:hypothetical protein